LRSILEDLIVDPQRMTQTLNLSSVFEAILLVFLPSSCPRRGCESDIRKLAERIHQQIPFHTTSRLNVLKNTSLQHEGCLIGHHAIEIVTGRSRRRFARGIGGAVEAELPGLLFIVENFFKGQRPKFNQPE
jgi:hypothetical protein